MQYGPDLLERGGSSQQTCGLHALLKKESEIFTLELLFPITPLLFFYLNHMCQVPSFPSFLSLSSTSTPPLGSCSLTLAGISFFLSSRCAFTVLISPTRCTCTGCAGKKHSKGTVVHADSCDRLFFFLVPDKQQGFNYDSSQPKWNGGPGGNSMLILLLFWAKTNFGNVRKVD